jgi:hypothetical protein
LLIKTSYLNAGIQRIDISLFNIKPGKSIKWDMPNTVHLLTLLGLDMLLSLSQVDIFVILVQFTTLHFLDNLQTG